MKLIAQNEHENQVIRGLAILLEDLGIEVASYRKEEAIASTFWSAEDFTMELAAIYNASKQDRESFLFSIEDKMRNAMIIAGYNVIKEELGQIKASQLGLTHRQLS